MAVINDGVVRAVGFHDVIEGLNDEVRLDAIPSHLAQVHGEKIQSPQRRELIEHQEQPALF